MVFLERGLVALRERDARLDEVRQEIGFRRRRGAGLGREVGGDVGDVVGRKLARDRIHHRILARAVLQRAQLRLEVGGLLSREIGDRVADADASDAVACGAHRCHFGFSGFDIRGRVRGGDHDERYRYRDEPFHRILPRSMRRRSFATRAANLTPHNRCRRSTTPKPGQAIVSDFASASTLNNSPISDGASSFCTADAARRYAARFRCAGGGERVENSAPDQERRQRGEARDRESRPLARLGHRREIDVRGDVGEARATRRDRHARDGGSGTSASPGCAAGGSTRRRGKP